MPKAILQFDLPKEQYEYETTCNAFKYRSVLSEYDQWLRGIAKYGSVEDNQAVNAPNARKKLWELLREEGIMEIS